MKSKMVGDHVCKLKIGAIGEIDTNNDSNRSRNFGGGALKPLVPREGFESTRRQDTVMAAASEHYFFGEPATRTNPLLPEPPFCDHVSGSGSMIV